MVYLIGDIFLDTLLDIFIRQFFCHLLTVIYRAAPIIMRIAKTLFKTNSDFFKKGSSIGHHLMAAIKPTLRTAFKHGCQALGYIIHNQEGPAAAPPVEPQLLHQDERNVGTEKPQNPQTGASRYKASRKQNLKH